MGEYCHGDGAALRMIWRPLPGFADKPEILGFRPGRVFGWQIAPTRITLASLSCRQVLPVYFVFVISGLWGPQEFRSW